MEIKTTLTAACRVCATLEEDTRLSVSVFGVAEYAPGRTTTAQLTTENIRTDLVERLRGVLVDIAAEHEHALGRKLQQAVYKSTEIAVQMGEL